MVIAMDILPQNIVLQIITLTFAVVGLLKSFVSVFGKFINFKSVTSSKQLDMLDSIISKNQTKEKELIDRFEREKKELMDAIEEERDMMRKELKEKEKKIEELQDRVSSLEKEIFKLSLVRNVNIENFPFPICVRSNETGNILYQNSSYDEFLKNVSYADKDKINKLSIVDDNISVHRLRITYLSSRTEIIRLDFPIKFNETIISVVSAFIPVDQFNLFKWIERVEK